MKWSTVVASVIVTAFAAIFLVAIGMKLGGGYAHLPQVVLQYVPAPEQEPSVPLVRRNSPTVQRPARPAAGTPRLATSDLLTQTNAISGTLHTINVNGVLTYFPTGAASGVPAKGILVNDGTAITLDGTAAKLAALRPGMDICFLTSTDDKPLEKLEVFLLLPDGQRHTKSGPIEAITAERITFLAGRRDLFPMAVEIGEETIVTIDGKAAKAGDLRFRMHVVVEYQGMDAKSIVASTVLMDGAPHRADGNIAQISADEMVLRVRGKEGFDVALKPGDGWKIQRETGRANAVRLVDATVADLRPGLHVIATYTNGVVANVTIRLPTGTGGGARPAAGNGALP